MAAKTAKDLLREIFPASTPGQAAQGSTGERLADRPDPRERPVGDYLPVIAVLVGAGLLALAFLRPVAPPVSAPPERSEETYSDDWQTTGQDY